MGSAGAYLRSRDVAGLVGTLYGVGSGLVATRTTASANEGLGADDGDAFGEDDVQPETARVAIAATAPATDWERLMLIGRSMGPHGSPHWGDCRLPFEERHFSTVATGT